jgi:hypothetical protein
MKKALEIARGIFSVKTVFTTCSETNAIPEPIFNQTPRKHPVTGKRTSRYKNNDQEILKIPGGIPQIVPREQWEKSRSCWITANKTPLLPGNVNFCLQAL